MRYGFLKAAGLLAMAAGSSVNAQTVFYSENFDSAVLDQQPQDTWVANTCVAPTPVFTHTPPPGWEWNDCQTKTFSCANPSICNIQQVCTSCANKGFREFEGWSFVDKNWWIGEQGDQERSNFTKGIGNVAVADPDAWDDRGGPASGAQFCGYMNAFMKTPAIDLTGIDAGSFAFSFDSSWRPEGFDDGPGTNNQTATIRAFYTVGGTEQPGVEVLHWDSNPNGPFFYADHIHENDTIVLDNSVLNVPAGATSVRFEFGLTNAGNDWWWAIDNLAATASQGGNNITRYTEDFEGVTLEPPIDAAPQGCRLSYCGQNVFTHTGGANAPYGPMTVAVDSPASGGVPEWRGWSFTTREYWYCAANNDMGTNNGALFFNSSGNIAVADGDEFDDATHEPGDLDTSMRTPQIDISGRNGGLMVLTFDSSWRWESGQTATIEATFDDPNNTTLEVLRWESDQASQFFKNDAPNERDAVPFIVPEGSSHVQFRFRYVGGNNWWWALDNIALIQGETTLNLLNYAPTTAVMAVAPSIDYAACFTPWSPYAPDGWTDIFTPIGACPQECGRTAFRGFTFLDKGWWIQEQGDQERSNFTKARGFVAVADPDAWDDSPNGQSNFNAFLTTPAQPLPAAVNSANLQFDSSWRPEGLDDRCSCDVSVGITSIAQIPSTTRVLITTDSPSGFPDGALVVIGGSDSVPPIDGAYNITSVSANSFSIDIGTTLSAPGTTGTAGRTHTNNQTAIVKAIYTVGGVDQPGVELIHWDSDPTSQYYYEDHIHENDTINLDKTALHIPSGATAVKFEFSLTNARNDWWWALDNMSFTSNGTQTLTENFEGVPNPQPTPLDDVPPVAACNYYSAPEAQPGSFTNNNADLGPCPTSGGDFEGWSAWVTNAWARSGGGARFDFLPNTAFVSDFDQRGCPGTGHLRTTAYGVAGVNEGTLVLTFDSSWGTGANHMSSVDVSYDNGTTWTPVLAWNPGNKVTTGNETVTVYLNNPAGAQTARLRFNDSNSGWWAISNLNLSGVVGSPACDPDVNQDGVADQGDVDYLINVIAGGENPSGIDPDFNHDGVGDQGDVDALINTIASGQCP
ncbi:MAG: hypothetical protein GC200_11670 [Tepidisphaera sp.]|nr:hypothetical protein [Tepidisphaera sp.]